MPHLPLNVDNFSNLKSVIALPIVSIYAQRSLLAVTHHSFKYNRSPTLSLTTAFPWLNGSE